MDVATTSAARPPKSSTKDWTKTFQSDWLTQPEFKGWLIFQNGKAKCKVCEATLQPGKSDLEKHGKGINHKKKMETFLNQDVQPHITKYATITKKVADVETAICAFMVENNMPLSKADQLTEFIKALPEKKVLEKIQLGKQKATNIIRQGMWLHFNKLLVHELDSKFFSIIIDETTDVSVKKQLAILVTYFDLKSFEMKTDLLDIVTCTDSTAEGIYTALTKSLSMCNVNTERWVGFCSDTTAAMMGIHNSVKTRIANNFPNVQIIKCSCHMIHLCSSHACEKLPSSLEDLCRQIYNHFNRSQKNTEAYKTFQHFHDVEVHKFLRPCQTRWLSLESSVTRIIDQWDALEAYWTLLNFEDPTHANALVLNTLRNPLQKCGVLFLKYTLSLFNDFNTFFQAEEPLFCQLKEKVVELLKHLLSNICDVAYVRSLNDGSILSAEIDVQRFVALRQVYLGPWATTFMEEVSGDPAEIDKVYRSAKEFYLEAIKQVKARFTFADPIFNDSAFLLPENAKALNPPSIISIAKRCTPGFVSYEELDKEWRSHCLLPRLELVTETREYWKIVCEMKNDKGDEKFPNLRVLVSFFFTLPFSNAAVERIFSDLKNVKTDSRNRLGDESTAGLLCTKKGMRRINLSAVEILKDPTVMPKMKVKANATEAESKELREAALRTA